jgi:putative peptidoglycan lipid II flippase
VGIAAFSMGLLNSIRHFTRPSLGPIVLNLCMISGLLLWRQDAVGLSCGVLAGGIAQLVIQWPVLRRAGMKLRFSLAAHPGLAQIRRLLIPRVAGTAVYQGSVLTDTIFASFSQWVGPGGVAALYFAHRFLHLPLGLFGVSMAQASLPAMASLVAANDHAAVKETFSLALRSSLLVAVPSSIGFFVLGHPIIQTLLQHGAFSSTATEMTVPALYCYAVGLTSLCAVKVLVNTLYAYQDTWTPVRSAAVALGINLVLNLLLIGPMGLAGLALATSLSSIWNALHLYRALRRRIGPLDHSLKSWFFRICLASVGQGAVAFFLWRWGQPIVVPHGVAAVAGWLLTTILAAAAAFFGLAALLKVQEANQLLRWIFRRN